MMTECCFTFQFRCNPYDYDYACYAARRCGHLSEVVIDDSVSRGKVLLYFISP